MFTCENFIHWYVMLVYDVGIWCWYMMLVYDVHIWELDVMAYDVDIWCSKINIFTTLYDVHSHVMFIYDNHIPTFHCRMWCSYVIWIIFICDVDIWSSVYEVPYMMLVYEIGMWCSYVMFICEHFRVGIWSSYMMITYDLARWSYAVPYMIIYGHFLKIFNTPKYRIWCSHVNISVYDVHMWTLFPMRCKTRKVSREN